MYRQVGRRRFKHRAAVAVCALVGIAPTFAATLTWDANGTTANIADGSGTWSTANNWYNGTNVSWTSGSDIAVLGNGGTAGSIYLTSATTVSGLTFASVASSAYSIASDNGSTLKINSGSVINVNNTAGTSIIDATVIPSANGAGFSISGSGNLTFNRAVGQGTSGQQSPAITMNGSGIVTFAGSTGTDNWGASVTVNSGTVIFAKTASASAHAVGDGATVAGGVLKLAGSQDDQFYDGGYLNINSGAFDMNARNETISTFNLQGVGYNTLGAIGNSTAGSSVLTVSGTTTIKNSAIVTAASNATLELKFNGTTNGNANILYKSGAGTVILSGSADNNSLSATVASGTLVLAKGSNSSVHAIGSPLVINGGAVRLGGTGDEQIYDGTGVTIDPGGIFDTDGRNETFNSLALSGTGGGSGAFRNGSGNSSITVSSATSFAGDTSVLASSGAFLEMILNGSITGDNHTLTKLGDGTLRLAGSGDNISLWINVSAGTVTLAKGSSSSVHAAAGVTGVASGSTLRLSGSGGDQIYDGTANAGIDFGLLNMNGRFDLNGMSEGFDKLTGNGLITNSGAGVTLTLGTNNGDGPSATVFSGTIQSAGSGNGVISVTKTGTGSQTLSGTADNVSVNVTVNAGTLILGKTSSSTVHAAAGVGGVSSGATLQLAGTGGDQIYDGFAGFDFGVFNMNGTLDLAGLNEGFDKLSGTGTVTNSVSATQSTLTLGTNNSNGSVTPTFSGSVQGSIALTKTGSGKITLAGMNTMSGAIAVRAGTLSLASTTSNNIANVPQILVGTSSSEAAAKLDVTGLQNGKLVLASGQTLGGHGTVYGSVDVSDGAILSPGASSGSLTISGGLSLSSSNSKIVVEVGGNPINGGVDFDVLNVTGNLSISGGQLVVNSLPTIQTGQEYQIIRATNYNASSVFAKLNGVAGSNSFSMANYSYTVRYETGQGVFVTFSSVPEPASLLPVVLIGLFRRRR